MKYDSRVLERALELWIERKEDPELFPVSIDERDGILTVEDDDMELVVKGLRYVAEARDDLILAELLAKEGAT